MQSERQMSQQELRTCLVSSQFFPKALESIWALIKAISAKMFADYTSTQYSNSKSLTSSGKRAPEDTFMMPTLETLATMVLSQHLKRLWFLDRTGPHTLHRSCNRHLHQQNCSLVHDLEVNSDQQSEYQLKFEKKFVDYMLLFRSRRNYSY
ncbi:MAG: hypothetical protein EZS28_015238 [Streblomastix strix]|uniref:Uncharacterized protein n=1 Tax=Streblomastix strix TaxID=222440 RepID=A0A5J4W327_9EUKA|nr:MAG: hypothetical protein EZS28_015238 [Streblomastix strix]